MPSIDVRGIRMYYEIHGEGFPFILVAGTGTHSQTWKINQVPYFSKKFKVVILDNRGIGKSDKPDAKYSTRMFAEDLSALMDALGLERAHVLGHSMGGRIAQWLALDQPGKIEKLVLAATGSGQYVEGMQYTRGVPLNTALSLLGKSFEEFIRGQFIDDFWYNPDFVKKSPELMKQIEQVFMSQIPEARPYLRHVIARQEHETTARLGEISMPTLVIVGENDRIRGDSTDHVDSSKVLAEKIPNAELVVIPRARHGMFWEEASATNEAIMSFLCR